MNGQCAEMNEIPPSWTLLHSAASRINQPSGDSCPRRKDLVRPHKTNSVIQRLNGSNPAKTIYEFLRSDIIQMIQIKPTSMATQAMICSVRGVVFVLLPLASARLLTKISLNGSSWVRQNRHILLSFNSSDSFSSLLSMFCKLLIEILFTFFPSTAVDFFAGTQNTSD